MRIGDEMGWIVVFFVCFYVIDFLFLLDGGIDFWKDGVVVNVGFDVGDVKYVCDWYVEMIDFVVIGNVDFFDICFFCEC